MASPDSRQKVSKLLYASLWRGVICAILATALLWTVNGWAQFGRKPTASKGPRAVGLLELAANGKGHLVPVVILYEGQFYDASSYKASPVPMALDSGTVYEAEKTGALAGTIHDFRCAALQRQSLGRRRNLGGRRFQARKKGSRKEEARRRS